MATPTRFSRRTVLGSSVLGGLALAAGFRPAHAADKVSFLTSWYAQAEHGGFYQAKATGMYEKAGIDATIRMGGPQVNAIQLLLAGEVDVIMGYDIQCLKAIEQGLPVITVGTSFQYDLQGMLTHDNVEEPRRPEGQDDPGGDVGAHHVVALAEEEVRLHRRADQGLHVQSAAVLRRQEHGAAGLSVVRAVPGDAAGHSGTSSSCSPPTAIRPTAPRW